MPPSILSSPIQHNPQNNPNMTTNMTRYTVPRTTTINRKDQPHGI